LHVSAAQAKWLRKIIWIASKSPQYALKKPTGSILATKGQPIGSARMNGMTYMCYAVHPCLAYFLPLYCQKVKSKLAKGALLLWKNLIIQILIPSNSMGLEKKQDLTAIKSVLRNGPEK